MYCNKQENKFLVWVLKVKDENCRIRIRTKMSRIHKTAKKSAVKLCQWFSSYYEHKMDSKN
jgi:hypothetical protein